MRARLPELPPRGNLRPTRGSWLGFKAILAMLVTGVIAVIIAGTTSAGAVLAMAPGIMAHG